MVRGATGSGVRRTVRGKHADRAACTVIRPEHEAEIFGRISFPCLCDLGDVRSNHTRTIRDGRGGQSDFGTKGCKAWAPCAARAATFMVFPATEAAPRGTRHNVETKRRICDGGIAIDMKNSRCRPHSIVFGRSENEPSLHTGRHDVFLSGVLIRSQQGREAQVEFLFPLFDAVTRYRGIYIPEPGVSGSLVSQPRMNSIMKACSSQSGRRPDPCRSANRSTRRCRRCSGCTIQGLSP